MGLYDTDDYIDAESWTDLQSRRPDAVFFKPLSKEQVAGIPDSFDLRSIGGVSPVKDKGKTPKGIGICWLFSALASMESYLLYKQKVNPSDPLNILSEMHGAYTAFDISNLVPAYVNPRGRKPGVNPGGSPAYGGNRYMAVNYLTCGSPAANCIDPYHKDDMIGQILPQRKWDITAMKPVKYYAKEFRYLPSSISPGDPMFLLQIKYHIQEYGSVACAMFWDDKYLHDLGGGEYAYHNYTTGNNVNHGINFIGWDDNYPVSKFGTTQRPNKAGAFLVQNNWGNIPGGKYFWISYESSESGIDAYCVARAEADFFEHPYRIYQHEMYGYNDLQKPYTDGTRSIRAKNVYTAVQGDKLAGIGFYSCTACYVDLTLEQGGISTVLISGYTCPSPGYYTVDLPAPKALNAGNFEIVIRYETLSQTQPAYVPLEVNDEKNIYIHWDIDPGYSFVEDGTQWEDVYNLTGPEPNMDYGYVCLRAIVENESSGAINLKTAYTALNMPAVNDGRIDAPPASAGSFDLEWRIEPFELETYSLKKSAVLPYIVDDPASGKEKQGFVNVSGASAETYLCATIGPKNNCMRKLFKAGFGTLSAAYAFNATAVPQYEITTNLSGHFAVPGAIVNAEANGWKANTKVKDNGSWEINAFSLYDPHTAWTAAYANTKINITIKSKNDLLLSSGSKSIVLANPAKKNGDNWEAYTVVGLIAAAAVGEIIYLMKDLCVPAGAGVGGGATFGAGRTNLQFDGEGHTIEFENNNTSMFDEAHDVRNLSLIRQRTVHPPPQSVKNSQFAAAGPIGGLVRKISKGGHVINCSIYGDFNGAAEIGGLFYEGEDVTVENCKVDLNVDNCGSYAGVAVKLNGTSNSVNNVSIIGKVKADKIAGAVLSIKGGTVKNISANIIAQGSSLAAGLLSEAENTNILSSAVEGAFTAGGAGGVAAGVTAALNNGSVENCRVSAVISAQAHAAGIAAVMKGTALVKHCYSACCLTGSSANALVSGIAGGIAGASDRVSKCVSVCSHLSGSKVARAAWNGASNCIAYNGITCDEGISFNDGGETKKAAAEFFNKILYEQLGWDFNIWQFNDTEKFPFLRTSEAGKTYDYPFLNPYPPQNGKFQYPVNHAIAITGAAHNRLTKLTWRLSPRLSREVSQTGEFLNKLSAFYLQIAALPSAGEYDLALITILDGHNYEMPVLLEIKG